MKLKLLRLFRRVWVEAALAAAGVATALHFLSIHREGWAVLALSAALAGAGTGVMVLRRAGTLALAWRCPRLDGLGLKPRTRAAPWDVLESADLALGALQVDAGRFGEFFHEARADLLKAAVRVLDAHRVKARAARALQNAPLGAARELLERQVLRADQELLDLNNLLRELRAQFVASTAPVPAVADPTPQLRALEQRSGALSAAIEELSVRGGS